MVKRTFCLSAAGRTIIILVTRMSPMCGPDRILIGKCDSKVCARSVPGSFPHYSSGRNDVVNVTSELSTTRALDVILVGNRDFMVCARIVSPL